MFDYMFILYWRWKVPEIFGTPDFVVTLYLVQCRTYLLCMHILYACKRSMHPHIIILATPSFSPLETLLSKELLKEHCDQ